MGFEINKLLIKDESKKPQYIPGGDNKTRIDISSLLEKDKALLHYLIVRFYDTDDNGILDVKEQHYLLLHAGETLNHDGLMTINDSCWVADKYIKSLINNLKNGNTEEIVEACGNLALAGPPPKEAVPVLICLLNHKEKNIRDRAFKTLGAVNKRCGVVKKYIPQIIEVFKNEDKRIRKKAAYLLEKIDLEHIDFSNIHEVAGSIPLFIRLLSDEDIIIRYSAARILSKTSKAAHPYLPQIINLLNSSDSTTQEIAADLLRNFGAVSAPALIDVFKKGKAPHIRLRAASLIAAESYTEDLLEEVIIESTIGLMSDDGLTRYLALRALEQAGKYDAKSVVPFLIIASKHDKSKFLRVDAEMILENLQAKNKKNIKSKR